MTTLIVSLIVFFIGVFVGRIASTGKARRQELVESTALARAWQEGFDAARLFAAGDAGAGKQRGEYAGPSDIGGVAFSPAPPQAVAPESPAPGLPWMTGSGVPGPMYSQAPAALPLVPVDPRVRALRNINITLYVAALLMVAAASLFIAIALPSTAKVVGLGLVTAGFYAAGLIMHARSERLRPAAAAFTATGLALLPMTGLAHFVLLPSSPGIVWLVTSVVGTVAFMYAAGKLQSRVIAALSTTFMVSTAYAGGAVLNRGLIYYFLFSMLLATAITLVGMRKPQWIGSIYLQSFSAAHRYLVPATLLAALVSIGVLDSLDYGWLFAAAAAYYVVALVAAKPSERFWHLAAARAAAMLCLVAFLDHADVPLATTLRILAVVFVAQSVLLAFLAGPYSDRIARKGEAVRTEIWVLLAAAAACAVGGFDGILRGGFRSAGPPSPELNWSLPVVLVAASLLARKLGRGFMWAPLGVGLLSLLEGGVFSAGRQAILLGAALAISWWLARGERTARTRALKFTARLVAPLAVGALFKFAALGWALLPNPSMPALNATGEDVGYLAGIRAGQIAGFVGFTLGVLVQVVWSALALRRSRAGRRPESADGVDASFAVGESAVFAGGVLLATATTFLVGGLQSMDRFSAGPGHGWSTEFWLAFDWDPVFMWLILAGGLLGATAVLGLRLPSGDRPESRGADNPGSPRWPRLLVHLGGVVAILAALLLAAGLDPSWLVEVVAMLSLAYVVSRLLAEDSSVPGVVYAVLAQVLLSGTAWHVADRFSMDSHGQFALLALTTSVAQSARVLAGRRVAVVRPSTHQLWLSIATAALLAMIPAAYLAGGIGTYDQAALLVQFLCLLLFATVFAATREPRGVLFHGAWALAGLAVLGLVLTPTLGTRLRAGGWLPVPLWGDGPAGIAMAVLVVAFLLAELRNVRGSGYRWLRMMLTVLFFVSILVLVQDMGQGWKVLAGVLGVVGGLVFASTWGLPLVVVGSISFLLYATAHGLDWFREAAGIPGGEPQDTMLLLCSTALILLIAAIFGGRFSGEAVSLAGLFRRTDGWSPAHARILFIGALVAVASAGFLGLVEGTPSLTYIGAGLAVVALCTASTLEVPATQRENSFEIAAMSTAAIAQRCWWVASDGFGLFAFAYYWVLVLAALAAYEFYRKRERRAVYTLVASMALLSLTGLGTILTSTLGQQMLVLLSFTALLVFGLLSNRRLFTLWAAVGIGVAVLWFLRGYTFVLLLLLAAGLIALALWRLGRMNKNAADAGEPRPSPMPEATAPDSGTPGAGPGAAEQPRTWL